MGWSAWVRVHDFLHAPSNPNWNPTSSPSSPTLPYPSLTLGPGNHHSGPVGSQNTLGKYQEQKGEEMVWLRDWPSSMTLAWPDLDPASLWDSCKGGGGVKGVEVTLAWYGTYWRKYFLASWSVLIIFFIIIFSKETLAATYFWKTFCFVDCIMPLVQYDGGWILDPAFWESRIIHSSRF